MTSEAFSTLPPQNVSAMQMWNAIRLATLSFNPEPPPPPPPETLQPPTNFAFSYYDTGSGIEITLTWGLPETGPTPENYYIAFFSMNLGSLTFTVAAFSQNISDTYSDAWNATIQSQKADYDPSSGVYISDNTPSAPYP